MSNTKHTPGPWRLSHHESNISKVYTEDGDLIADCTIGQGQYPYNAKLIAAAPELLEYARCEQEFSEKGWFTTNDGCQWYRGHAVNKLDALRGAAIKKATE